MKTFSLLSGMVGGILLAGGNTLGIVPLLLCLVIYIMTEHVFPLGLYMRVSKKAGKQIRIF